MSRMAVVTSQIRPVNNFVDERNGWCTSHTPNKKQNKKRLPTSGIVDTNASEVRTIRAYNKTHSPLFFFLRCHSRQKPSCTRCAPQGVHTQIRCVSAMYGLLYTWKYSFWKTIINDTLSCVPSWGKNSPKKESFQLVNLNLCRKIKSKRNRSFKRHTVYYLLSPSWPTQPPTRAQPRTLHRVAPHSCKACSADNGSTRVMWQQREGHQLPRR